MFHQILCSCIKLITHNSNILSFTMQTFKKRYYSWIRLCIIKIMHQIVLTEIRICFLKGRILQTIRNSTFH